MARMRRRYDFRGHVQGVGFRATTCWIARGFAIVGYVRNLPGGAVEVVAEGEPEELDQFRAELLQKMGGHIRDWDEAVQVPSEPFVTFEVRY